MSDDPWIAPRPTGGGAQPQPSGAGHVDWLKCRVLLFRGKGFISSLIRWQTRCNYTHAAILMPDGRVIESREFAGVQVVDFDVPPGVTVDQFTVPTMDAEAWQIAVQFCQDQLGKGYDYKGVVRFISRRPGGSPNRWFCSELVFAALDMAGVRLLRRIPPEEVSPALLARSPLLIGVGAGLD